jgi:hypothetical protein
VPAKPVSILVEMSAIGTILVVVKRLFVDLVIVGNHPVIYASDFC